MRFLNLFLVSPVCFSATAECFTTPGWRVGHKHHCSFHSDHCCFHLADSAAVCTVTVPISVCVLLYLWESC